MSSIPCPFCGELTTAPLRFCVSCGRGVSPDDLQHSGLKIVRPGGGDPSKRISESGVRSGRFARSRRDYTLHRQLRSIFWTSTCVMVLILGYFCTMRYVLHEHLPFKVDVMLERLVTGAPVLDEADKTTTASRPDNLGGAAAESAHNREHRKNDGKRHGARHKSKHHQSEIVRAR